MADKDEGKQTAKTLKNVFSTRDKVNSGEDLASFVPLLIETVAKYRDWDDLNARNFLEGLSLHLDEELHDEGGAFTQPGELKGRGMTWRQVAEALVSALHHA